MTRMPVIVQPKHYARWLDTENETFGWKVWNARPPDNRATGGTASCITSTSPRATLGDERSIYTEKITLTGS